MRIDEYWITDKGKPIIANGEYGEGHEDVVINFVISKILSVIGYDDESFNDRIEFRTWLGDVYFPDKYGWEEEDPYGKLAKEMSKVSKYPIEELSVISGGSAEDDARIVAVNLWKWIRVAGPNAEVPDFSEATLKRLGEGLLDILVDEEGYEFSEEMYGIRINVSTYKGSNNQNRTMTIGELLSGEGGESGSEYSRTSSDISRRMDIATQPKYYGSRLGDSLRIITNLLEAHDIG